MVNIKKVNDKRFDIESESRPGTIYSVDPKKPFCSCPGYRFYYQRQGNLCKHIQVVQKYVVEHETEQNQGVPKEEILSYVKEHEPIESIELIEKFSEEAINTLLEQGELIEEKGKIRVLN